MAYSAQRSGTGWIRIDDGDLQELLTKWSKNATAEIRAALQQPMAIAQATASHIHDRVIRGQFASPPQPYKQRATAGPRKHKSYYISPAYAVAAGLGERTKFRSSAEMHGAIGSTPGKSNVTGGMWRGLQVRNYGSEFAVIEFGGSSLGSKSVLTANSKAVKDDAGQITYKLVPDKNGKMVRKQVRELARDTEGNVTRRRKPRLERNNVKAFAVFKHLGVNILEPRSDEVQAMWAAVVAQAGLVISAAFGAQSATAQPGGNPALYGAIIRQFRRA